MTTFAISGMTCANCAKKVESTLKAIAGEAMVTLDPPRAIVAGVDIAKLNSALAAVGKYRLHEVGAVPAVAAWLATYYPLLLVMGLIAAASFASPTPMGWMMNFMAGFYIIFGAFKLLDVPSFANAYARYDVIAKHFKPWAYAYPFIETALGFGFLFNYDMIMLSWIALALSTIGTFGVVQAIYAPQPIQCACLGTVFKLPMSVVTVVENVGMAAMAAWMIWGM